MCYWPLDNDAASLSLFFEKFQLILDKIRQFSKKYNIVILGDLNAHFNSSSKSDCTDTEIQLYSFLEYNGLTQSISEPTRTTQHHASILDLVITNSSSLFTHSGILSSPSNCDHSIIFANMNVDIYKCHAFRRQVWNFSNVDVSALNNALLGVNWNQLFENQSNIDVAYQKWYSKFRHIL